MSHPHPAEKPAEEADEWQPHAPETFQQIGRIGQIAIGLLGLSLVTRLLSTWSDWNSYDVVARYLNGSPGVENVDIDRADTIARYTSIPNIVVAVATAVVFVLWLWRARVNSEVFCQADHRHSHGWVLISWFCPGPNFWYPRQVVEDVWVASDPATPAWTDRLRPKRNIMIIDVWWYTWVTTMVLDIAVRRVLMEIDPSPLLLRMTALSSTLALVLSTVSAVFAALLIRKVTAMQVGRPWEPWWDQREPTARLSAVPANARADADLDATAVQQPVALRRSRQPELKFASAVGADAPRFGSTPVQAPLKAPGAPMPAAGVPGSGMAAAAGGAAAAQTSRLAAVPGPRTSQPAQRPAARPEARPEVRPEVRVEEKEEAPVWSPFAPVVNTWQEPETSTDALGSTAGYAAFKPDAYTPESQQSALGKPMGDTTSFMPSGLDATLPSWGAPITDDPLQPSWRSAAPETPAFPVPPVYQAPPSHQPPPAPTYQSPSSYEPYVEPVVEPEPTVTPPALSVVPPLPAESYGSDYSDSFDPGYLPPSRPIPTPDIEAPVRRSTPGRRAAAVAVDSPSSVQRPAEPTYDEQPEYGATASFEQAPVLPGPPPAPADEYDYLMPSQSLPPVLPELPSVPAPVYEPEPTYNPSYSSETYSSYGSDSYESSTYDSGYTSSYTPDPEPAPAASTEDESPTEPEKPVTPRVHPRRRWA
ncbi:DUF4328 domain-containing protein [Kribbella deserti]|uniref:DUF4328 domain-containing protein n=1 Tax=Kribbella deserti TaxID=1926257 RepID=A0ABV6QTT7_9ACTN